MIAGLDNWRRHRLAETRRIIHEVDPEVVEDWKLRGTLVWSHEGMYADVDVFKGQGETHLSSWREVSDPNNVFDSGCGGTKFRVIDIREADETNETDLEVSLRGSRL